MGETRGVINEIAPALRAFAKGQRSSMTQAEFLLWQNLRAGRSHARKFKRQVPIGTYIVDFLCASERLVIELNGIVHDTHAAQASDRRRQDWLERQGFTVIRFRNDDVLGNYEVLRTIANTLDVPSPAKGERVLAVDAT